jgi:hypothetical protein
MTKSKATPVTIQDVLLRVLCAAVAAWAALSVDSFLLSNYAGSRVWETWVQAGTSLHAWLPVVVFGLITGLGIGVAVGLIFPQSIALKIAAIAAGLQLVESLFAGGIVSSIAIAVGLLAGALPSRVTR